MHSMSRDIYGIIIVLIRYTKNLCMDMAAKTRRSLSGQSVSRSLPRDPIRLVIIAGCVVLLYVVYALASTEFGASDMHHADIIVNQMKQPASPPLPCKPVKIIVPPKEKIIKKQCPADSVMGEKDPFLPIELSNDAFYTACDARNKKTFNALERIVHLDLKGAPPRMTYFAELFPLLYRMGATGLLIEYEDMFPYSGALKGLAAANAYSLDDIKQLLKLALDNGLRTIIPLVPTFGHMSFVLKYEQFRKLREYDDRPQIIRPLYPASLTLIGDMIRQVASAHRDSINYLHIGCDEVWPLGNGKVAKQMKERNMSVTDVMFRHVKDVLGLVPGDLVPIMWDDIFRWLSLKDLQKFDPGKKVEPMVWQYSPRPQDHLPRDIWERYSAVFDKLWAASAFKGATGSFKVVTDSAYHLSNHLHWIEIIKANATLFRGTALTGWQRYDHFATLCELLPVAVPTLAFSLQALANGCFTKTMYELASHEILVCAKEYKLKVSLPRYTPYTKVTETFWAGMCKFPGWRVYDGAMQMYVLQQYFAQEGVQSGLNSWMNRYNIAWNYSTSAQMALMTDFLDHISEHLSALRKTMDWVLLEIYDKATLDEWMVVNVASLEEQVKETWRRVKFLSKFRTWRRRPFIPSPTP